MTDSTRTDSSPFALTDRQEVILRLVVQRHLATGEPVASHEIIGDRGIDVSSATVRAEFAALTNLGLLEQPHAAAGRLPTDDAIRRYARAMVGQGALPFEMQARIEKALSTIKDELELLLEETSQLLYEQTECVGVVLAPRDQWGHLETIRLAPVESRGLLVALVFAWGHVESIVTTLPVDLGQLDLPMLERFLVQELAGRHLHDLDPGRIERAFALAKQRSIAHRALFEPIERFVQDLAAQSNTKVVARGILHVASHPLFDLQPQLHVLLKLAQDPSFTPQVFLDMNPARPGVRVKVGTELGGAEFAGLATIWAPFGRTDGQGGKVGIFGPARMPYARAIPLVEFIAALLDRNLPSPRLVN